ncbi:MAG: YfhO family protein [Acidobacteriota bacterium]
MNHSLNHVEADENNNAQSSRFRQHLICIAFILAAMVAMFWRVFFLGETLIDVATLDNQLPWGYSTGETSNHPYNRRDLTDTYATREYFILEAYRDGEMPLWNPYTMAGHPIYADGVTKIFSPFLIFYYFFDPPLGYSLARIAELMLAAILMYTFLICIGAGAEGSVAGTLVFSFSSHSMFHLTGLGWWGGLAWLPLIILFADRAATRRSYRYAILAGVCLAAQFFCGWMQNQIYYVGAVALYYLLFAFRHRSRQPLALMTVTLAVGFALSVTQWLPVMELLAHSNRKIVLTEIGYIHLPPWYLLTLVFPNLFGEADDVKTLNLFAAINVSHDHILYISIAALAMVGFCLHAHRRKLIEDEERRFRISYLLLLAGIALLLMMATPLYVYVTRFIPVLQVIRVTVRAGALFIFAASALAGFGMNSFLNASRESLESFFKHARKFFIAAISLVALAMIASIIFRQTGFASDVEGRGKINFLRRAASVLSEQFLPPNLDIVLPLVFISLTVALIALFKSGKLRREFVLTAMIALIVVDLFWHDRQFNPSFDGSRVFPRTQITDLLRSLPPGRVLVAPSDMETNRKADSGDLKIIAPPNTLLPYRISSVSGKNQQFPRWYRDYATLVEPQPYLSHVVFDQSRSKFLDILGVRYLLTHWSRPAPAGYRFIASAEGLSVYENEAAMPRAFLVGEVIEVGDCASALRAMSEENFDPAKTVILEGGSVELQRQVTGEAIIVEDRRNRVVIKTRCAEDSILVLSDNFYPGWKASVDGKPSMILKANCTMRAVQLPAGEHVVSFEFAPATLKVSIYASLASLMIVIGALIVIEIRKRR